MRHKNALFSKEAFDEWLIYFKNIFPDKFSIAFVNENYTTEANGTARWIGPPELELSLSILAQHVEVTLQADESLPPHMKFIRDVQRTGTMIIDGCQSARIRIGESERLPLVSFESSLGSPWLEVWKAREDIRLCPMYVTGIPGCQVVLDEYHFLRRRESRSLPRNPPKRYFIGSCRSVDATRYHNVPMAAYLSAVVALFELVIRHYFYGVES